MGTTVIMRGGDGGSYSMYAGGLSGSNHLYCPFCGEKAIFEDYTIDASMILVACRNGHTLKVERI